ncbi:cytochrome P450 [Artomyces pyxidatus]|uniref:Cytochrome P450 n=1 Tax=Artomyces pyxidatus TaxID=48021 RepID=A0ACB8SWD2_9AGAM|nr:cytochrome P450 [Artomyces pyxidatus]
MNPLQLTSMPGLPSIAISLFYVAVAACALVVSGMILYRIKQLPLRKIPGPPSSSLLSGHYGPLFTPEAGLLHERLFKLYGRVFRISGTLGDSQLIVADSKACHSILLKEQDIFEESPWFLTSNNAIFGAGLTSTQGAHHRKQRKLLNPVFSIKHMRSMIPLFQQLTHQLQDIIRTQVQGGAQEIDMMEWFALLALELVSQGGLGHSFDSLVLPKRESDFARAVKELVPTLSTLAVWREWYPLVSGWVPPRLLRLGAACLPLEALHRAVSIADIMHVNVKKVFDRKKALLVQGDLATVSEVQEGNDIISILLKANTAASDEDRLPEEEIVAQMGTLLSAGSDTTSSALARTIHLLSQHHDIQDKLRKELVEAGVGIDGTELAYDELIALPYLEAVCRETLRLHPPAPIMTRTARADTTIPLSRPITTTSGDTTASLYVPRNTSILINITSINRDPDIWGADAAEWKPERWLAPLPESVEEAHIPGIYSNTLTFLGGGRACIGFKFAQLEMKVALSQLVTSFRFSPSKKEIVWRLGGIVTPSVKGSQAVGANMPIMVENV